MKKVEQCPWCGAPEIELSSPGTMYSCGTTCYDQRDGTWEQSKMCRRNEQAWWGKTDNLKGAQRMNSSNNVSLQVLSDCGVNPFAVQLLAESYAQHPDPKPVQFKYESTKDGKPICVFVRLDPTEPKEI
jgi:hypothetical protein